MIAMTLIGFTLVGTAAISGLFAAARHRLTVMAVRGVSMEPTLSDGDRVLVRRTRFSTIRPGQLVVLEHPDDGGGYRNRQPDRRIDGPVWMIKRCGAVSGDPVPSGLQVRCPTPDGRVPPRMLTVLSDNPRCPTDSRRFGFIPGDRVLGVVIRVFSR